MLPIPSLAPADTMSLVPVPNLVWYKTDSIAQSEGTAVAAWTDSCSTGYNLSQATSGRRPTFKTNILNGKPVVRFDMANFTTLNNLATVLTLQAPFTFITVLSFTNPASTPVWWESVNAGGAQQSGGASLNIRTDSKLELDKTATTVIFKEATALSTSTYYVLTITYSGTVAEWFINGTSAGTNSVTSSLTNCRMQLGGTGTAGPSLTGDIAEHQGFTRVLGTADRHLAERALGVAFGITVA